MLSLSRPRGELHPAMVADQRQILGEGYAPAMAGSQRLFLHDHAEQQHGGQEIHLHPLRARQTRLCGDCGVRQGSPLRGSLEAGRCRGREDIDGQ